ncbi:MAG: glycosyltransferase family 4 protein [Omnitrophica bacterium]|nr:glycosyltransferase family 4 protein [Candidatus Omnitrophota bacterium]
MKNILMISYAWPPVGSVGMIRMAKFAKYLIRSGYGITVLTKDAPQGKVVWDLKEPELDKVKIYRVPASRKNSVKDRINPQLEIAWFHSVKKRLNTLRKNIKCDVIISSSPPESAHLIACELKKILKKPWIADLRDLWSQDHYRSFGPIRRKPLEWEEKKILKQADRIVTVSDEWGKSLGRDYGDRVHVITNAFDTEWYKDPVPPKKGKFRISYLGKLNGNHQNIIPFLNDVKHNAQTKNIPKEGLRIDFYVYGYGKPDIRKMAAEYNLEKIVYEHEPVSLSEAIDIMKSSHLLLLVGWKGMSSQGWRPQKVYEYIGSGTPIVLINGEENTELSDLIRSTPSGIVAGPIGPYKPIRDYYNKHTTEKTGKIEDCESTLAGYKAENTTGKLMSLIEEL